MGLEQVKLVIEQGATFSLSLRWYSDEAKTALRDLSAWSAKMQGRVRAEAAETIFDLSSSNGDITLGNGTGTENITVVIAASASANLPPNCRGVYDLRLTDPQGVVWEVIDGEFVVRAGVTR